MSSIRNTKTWVKITVVVVALALAGSLVWIFVITPLISCGPDVQRVDEQCIGVTDGRVALRADLADVLGKIHQENERVGPEAVSVGYLMPLPKSSDDELATLMRHELEGAYIAQLEANQTETFGDKPLIRLLVANSGDESSQRQQVVSDLLAKVNSPERLVSIVVTGKTKAGTIDAIDALRRGGVPVVTSRLAGDSLTNLAPTEQAQLTGGLARLAPTGSGQAAAAATYLRQDASRALIVRDTNPDDPFLQSLEEGFRQRFQDGTHTVLEPPEKYDSRLGIANTMKGIIGDICQQKPNVIFFAGRSAGLAVFVQALPRRPCPEVRINIVASGDAVEFVSMAAQGDRQQQIRDGLMANASVRYTAQAHPESWKASPSSFSLPATQKFTLSCSRCFKTLFPGENLEDGVAIIGNDAIVTTVTAIRLGEGGINDKPDLISQEFNRLRGRGAVPGASGWISLDEYGTPVNKAVDIMEVNSNGTQQFVTISSSSGSPCVPETPPC